MTMEKEQLLIEQLKQGQEAAYRLLFQRHYAALCHLARELVGDDYTAETLVGDVIFHLWEVRQTVDIQVSLRSYLARSVRNRCLDYLASRRERTEVAFSALDADQLIAERYILSDSQPLGELLEQELEDVVRQAVASLPGDCRRVFCKSRFEGKKYEEIARELDISVNTVKYHIKHALALLHARLGKYMTGLLLGLFLLE